MKFIVKGLALTAFLLAGLHTHASNTPITNVTPNYVTSTYAKTKYPVVFAHGLFGFKKLGDDGFGLDYWYQILPDLARNGANVWNTRQSAANSSEVRGEQFLAQAQEILAITGQPKLNLIGHSHGSQTVRYVAGVIPDQIASVTTIAGPAKGSGMADFLVNTLTPLGVDGAVGKIIDVAVNFITIGQQEDPKKYPMDSLASAHSLSRVGATNFNAKFPAGVPTTACGEGEYITNGVRHYSFSGAKTVTNLLDPLDYVTTLTGAFMGSAPHDGLVSSCSSHFGQVIRDDYYWNHFDEVNQLLGLKSVFSQDPVSVYRQHLNRLKLAGV